MAWHQTRVNARRADSDNLRLFITTVNKLYSSYIQHKLTDSAQTWFSQHHVHRAQIPQSSFSLRNWKAELKSFSAYPALHITLYIWKKMRMRLSRYVLVCFNFTWCAMDPSGVAALVLVAASCARPRSCDIVAMAKLGKDQYLCHESCPKPSTIIITGGHIVDDPRARVVCVNTPAPWQDFCYLLPWSK